MRKPNRLTAKFVEQVKTPGDHRDGIGGLLPRVEPTGAKRWVLRTTVRGKRRELGLGSARDVTLKEAREKAFEMRKAARAGRDPVAVRKGSITFKEAAETVHEQRSKGFRNSKHAAQWISSLKSYAFPVIGPMSVGDVLPADVRKAL